MNRALEQFDVAGGWLAEDLRVLIADSEALLLATAEVTDASMAAFRTQFEIKLARARAALENALLPTINRASETMLSADSYLRGNAWTAIGVATLAGLIVGLMAARR